MASAELILRDFPELDPAPQGRPVGTVVGFSLSEMSEQQRREFRRDFRSAGTPITVTMARSITGWAGMRRVLESPVELAVLADLPIHSSALTDRTRRIGNRIVVCCDVDSHGRPHPERYGGPSERTCRGRALVAAASSRGALPAPVESAPHR
jgi:hypothetical protein